MAEKRIPISAELKINATSAHKELDKLQRRQKDLGGDQGIISRAQTRGDSRKDGWQAEYDSNELREKELLGILADQKTLFGGLRGLLQDLKNQAPGKLMAGMAAGTMIGAFSQKGTENTISSGMERYRQRIIHIDAEARSVKALGDTYRDYERRMMDAGKAYGYNTQQILSLHSTLAAATGRMGAAQRPDDMRTIQGVARGTGMDLNTTGSLFDRAIRNDTIDNRTGATKEGLGTREFAALMTDAVVRGQMQGRDGEMIGAINRLIESMTSKTPGVKGAATTGLAAEAMATISATGIRAFQGDGGASSLEKLNGAIMNPQGDAAEMLFYNQVTGGQRGKMNTAEYEYLKEEGLAGISPITGKSNMESLFNMVEGLPHEGKWKSLAAQNLIPGMSMHEWEKLEGAFMKGGKFDTVKLGALESRLGKEGLQSVDPSTWGMLANLEMVGPNDKTGIDGIRSEFSQLSGTGLGKIESDPEKLRAQITEYGKSHVALAPGQEQEKLLSDLSKGAENVGASLLPLKNASEEVTRAMLSAAERMGAVVPGGTGIGAGLMMGASGIGQIAGAGLSALMWNYAFTKGGSLLKGGASAAKGWLTGKGGGTPPGDIPPTTPPTGGTPPAGGIPDPVAPAPGPNPVAPVPDPVAPAPRPAPVKPPTAPAPQPLPAKPPVEPPKTGPLGRNGSGARVYTLDELTKPPVEPVKPPVAPEPVKPSSIFRRAWNQTLDDIGMPSPNGNQMAAASENVIAQGADDVARAGLGVADDVARAGAGAVAGEVAGKVIAGSTFTMTGEDLNRMSGTEEERAKAWKELHAVVGPDADWREQYDALSKLREQGKVAPRMEMGALLSPQDVARRQADAQVPFFSWDHAASFADAAGEHIPLLGDYFGGRRDEMLKKYGYDPSKFDSTGAPVDPQAPAGGGGSSWSEPAQPPTVTPDYQEYLQREPLVKPAAAPVAPVAAPAPVVAPVAGPAPMASSTPAYIQYNHASGPEEPDTFKVSKTDVTENGDERLTRRLIATGTNDNDVALWRNVAEMISKAIQGQGKDLGTRFALEFHKGMQDVSGPQGENLVNVIWRGISGAVGGARGGNGGDDSTISYPSSGRAGAHTRGSTVDTPGDPVLSDGAIDTIAPGATQTDGFHSPRAGMPRHGGVDLAGTRGQPVRTPEAGTVVAVSSGQYGRYVIVKTKRGHWYFGHLERFSVKEGQSVSAGQQIGEMGDSGAEGMVHVHVQFWPNGNNPSGQEGTEDPSKILEGIAGEREQAPSNGRGQDANDRHSPSGTAGQDVQAGNYDAGAIDGVLAGSGLAGQGDNLLKLADKYDIPPELALAMFRKEASFMSAGAAVENNNPGNLVYTGQWGDKIGTVKDRDKNGKPSSYWAAFDDPEAGMEGYMRLLDQVYRTYIDGGDWKGMISKYAPSSDNNNVEEYTNQIEQWMEEYRKRIERSGTRNNRDNHAASTTRGDDLHAAAYHSMAVDDGDPASGRGSYDVSEINDVLDDSGMEGQGKHIAAMAKKYNVPVELALSMFRKESSFFSKFNRNKAENNNPGNLKYTGRNGESGEGANGFAQYDTLQDGIEGYFMLMNRAYRDEISSGDYAGMVNRYAPSDDQNDPEGYYQQLIAWMKEYRERVTRDLGAAYAGNTGKFTPLDQLPGSDDGSLAGGYAAIGDRWRNGLTPGAMSGGYADTPDVWAPESTPEGTEGAPVPGFTPDVAREAAQMTVHITFGPLVLQMPNGTTQEVTPKAEKIDYAPFHGVFANPRGGKF
jgi:murein DD-endopeptidase MepM/ murein hydrolase activator NlpD